MPRETWEEEEISLLYKFAHTYSRQAISEMLGGKHSEAAVRHKIRSLGLASKLSASERLKATNDKGDGKIGEKYGILTVVRDKELTHKGAQALYQVLCICECGRQTLVLLTNLRRGRSKSCGCVKAKKAGDRTRTHGMTKTHLYRCWHKIKHNKRKAKVCESWRQFEKFRDWSIENGYRKGLSIILKDVNGNYEPNNCWWGTQIDVANNRPKNRRETAWGETKTVAEWARDKRCIVSYEVLLDRLESNNWDIERAIVTPCKEIGKLSPAGKKLRIQARMAVRVALRNGSLAKLKCEHPGCNSQYSEAHHYMGYQREFWLDVVWLCKKHHTIHEMSNGSIKETRS